MLCNRRKRSWRWFWCRPWQCDPPERQSNPPRIWRHNSPGSSTRRSPSSGQADGTIDPEAPSIYRSRIPNCNVAFVYDAGHDIAAERPQALLNLVADYLERRETFIVQNRAGAINP